MQKQLTLSTSTNRNNALSPRVVGTVNSTESKSPTILEGPTQLSSKMGANSQTTQASSKLQSVGQLKFPMSAQDASRLLAPYLLDYEKKEILEFETVYYFNVQERIKNQGNAQLPGGSAYGKLDEATNNGFDSD